MLPTVRQVDRLIEDSLLIDGITNAILDASNEAELIRQHSLVMDLEEHVHFDLPSLRILMSGNTEINQFGKAINDIFGILEEQITLVSQRNRLVNKRDLLVARALTASRSIGERTKPALIETTTHLYSETDRVRSQLLANDNRDRKLIERFDQLMSVDVQAMQQFTEISNHAQSLTDAFEVFSSISERSVTARTNEHINISLRALARLAVTIKDQDFRMAVGGQLGEIAKITRGTDGMVEVHLSILDATRELQTLSEEGVRFRGELNQLAEKLKESADAAVNESILDAKNVIYLARYILIGIALMAFVTAIWVIWRFVMSDVVARIDRLASITRRLAAGDLDVAIDVEGRDELGEVVDAMRLFKENAVELRKSNADLEEFAYAASHDLKAPLRGIGNIASWIKEDLGENLTDESNEHLELLKNRIERMGLLLDDLLQYSRAGRESSEVRYINLHEHLPELFELMVGTDQLKLELKNTLPRMNTATAPLELVFRNLFSNSLKHCDKETGKIQVECNLENNRYHFIVSDDGPGIPVDYHERVFGMFQTMKGRDEVEGSGVGLSITRRHIESVGCQIWIERRSQETRGAVFHFTWPVEWPKAMKKVRGIA